MYLQYNILLVTVLSFFKVCSSDCSCNLNRNGQCSKEENEIRPGHKYTSDLNYEEITSKPTYDITNMVLIKANTFEMGTNKPVFRGDMESPARNVTINNDFYLDKYEVSNKDFHNFVRETGYKSEAESFGDSFVFEMALPEKDRNSYQDLRAAQAPWWIKLDGAMWKHPEGPESIIEGINEKLKLENII